MPAAGAIIGGVASIAGAAISGSSARGSARDAARAQQAAIELEREKFQIQKDEYDRFLELYAPLEEELVGMTDLSPTRIEGEVSRADQDVVDAFTRARETHSRQLSRFGVQPSGWRHQADMRDFAIEEAGARVDARNRTRRAFDDVEFNRKFQVAGLGKGIPGGVISGMSSAGYRDIASTSAAEAGRAGSAAGSLLASGINQIGGAINTIYNPTPPPAPAAPAGGFGIYDPGATYNQIQYT